MEQLLEILQDIDDSVDYETETKLIDDHRSMIQRLQEN